MVLTPARIRSALHRYRHVLGEGGWVVFGQAAVAVGMLAGTRLVTEYVPPEVFGKISLLLGIAGLLKILLCFPITQSVLRLYADAARDRTVHRLRRVAGRLVMGATLLGSAALIVSGVIQGVSDDWASGWFPVLAALLMAAIYGFDNLRTLEIDLLSSARRQKPVAISRVADTLTRPLLIVGCVMIVGANALAVLMGHALANILNTLGLTLLTDRIGVGGDSAPAADSRAGGLLREILRYGLPLAPLALFGWVMNLSNRYIIHEYLGEADTGKFVAVSMLVSAPMLMLHGIVDIVLRPRFFDAVAHSDARKEHRVFLIQLASALGIGLVGLLGIYLAYPLLLWVAVDERYREVGHLMPWIALGYVFFGLTTVYQRRCYAHKRTVRILVVEAVSAVVCLLSQVLMIRSFGLIGAAWAAPIYYAAQWLASALAARGLTLKELQAQSVAVGPVDNPEIDTLSK